MAAIQRLCGRAILLHQGSLVGDGHPKEMITNYMADASAAGTVSLRDWKDRVSSDDGKITSLEVWDERGSHVNSVSLGDKVRFVFTIEFNRMVTRPRFGLLVHSAMGEAILDLRSPDDSPCRIDGKSTCVTVEAVVNNIGLYPGEYTLSPWVGDQSTRTNIDYVRHCCKLSILPTAGIHVRLDPNRGKYFIPSFWSIRNSGGARVADLSGKCS